MWLRMKATGTAAFVSDHNDAFALVDAGEAEAIDAMPERSAVPVVDAPVPAAPKARRKK